MAIITPVRPNQPLPECHHCGRECTDGSVWNCGLVSCIDCKGCEHNKKISKGKAGPPGVEGLVGV